MPRDTLKTRSGYESKVKNSRQLSKEEKKVLSNIQVILTFISFIHSEGRILTVFIPNRTEREKSNHYFKSIKSSFSSFFVVAVNSSSCSFFNVRIACFNTYATISADKS